MCVALCTGQGGEQDRDVHLQLKHGVEAKNYDDVSIVCVCVCVCVCACDMRTLFLCVAGQGREAEANGARAASA